MQCPHRRPLLQERAARSTYAVARRRARTRAARRTDGERSRRPAVRLVEVDVAGRIGTGRIGMAASTRTVRADMGLHLDGHSRGECRGRGRDGHVHRVPRQEVLRCEVEVAGCIRRRRIRPPRSVRQSDRSARESDSVSCVLEDRARNAERRGVAKRAVVTEAAGLSRSVQWSFRDTGGLRSESVKRMTVHRIAGARGGKAAGEQPPATRELPYFATHYSGEYGLGSSPSFARIPSESRRRAGRTLIMKSTACPGFRRQRTGREERAPPWSSQA